MTRIYVMLQNAILVFIVQFFCMLIKICIFNQNCLECLNKNFKKILDVICLFYVSLNSSQKQSHCIVVYLQLANSIIKVMTTIKVQTYYLNLTCVSHVNL